MSKKAITFHYEASVTITADVFRSTLENVRDRLLSHDINGEKNKLNMSSVCHRHSCGTAACIGGWASIFLLGFEADLDKPASINAVSSLFDRLITFGPKVRDLFYEYEVTKDYNEPNVAATAIQRYLDGKKPWPRGTMPNVLPYKRRRTATKAATA